MAVSADMLRWERPRRMMFESPGADSGYTYSRVEPLERTYNVVPIQRGYAMLLAQGFVRYSEDLVNWGAPRKIIPQDLHRNRLLKTPDGAVWAVYENSSDELQPYTDADRLHGYFVTGGKRYRHVTELCVSRSVDGRNWQPAGKILVPGQPGALWAFPLSERQIGVAAAFNNLYVRWFTASHVRDLRPVDAQLRVMHQTGEAECFASDGSLSCVRPVFDFEKQGPMLLATSSRALYERLTE
ncbi:MAG: hypothetical protein GY953_28380 [bacterium]|nr:hypothetical protein [bacterium]